MQKYNATIYIRLSYTDDKSSESDSVANQRKLIEDFIRCHPEIEIVSEKVDDGYSGILFDRPQFKEMMQDIMDGKTNCVIVKDAYVKHRLKKISHFYSAMKRLARFMARVNTPQSLLRFLIALENLMISRNSRDTPRSPPRGGSLIPCPVLL